MIKIGEIVMDMKFSDRREYLLPDITKSSSLLDKDYAESQDFPFPTIDTIIELLPERRRQRKMAAKINTICYSLAGDFLESQDESVMDDYNFI